MTTVDELAEYVRGYFAARADAFALDADGLSATYVLNWGGFVNHSFTLSDGLRSYHLKLAGYPESLENLRRWAALHTLLEERYRAPRMIEWVRLPDGHEGMLFEHIPGTAADFARDTVLLTQVPEVLRRLHADAELAQRLASPGATGTCLDSFTETYIRRFDEDLSFIEQEPPDFVPRELLDWMQSETRRLEVIAIESGAFAERGTAPIHGDLWENNFRVAETGEWFVLDWDNLTLGDPALDYSIFLWNLVREQAPGSWRAYLPGAIDAAFAERMELYLRAALLDGAIDVLADYIDAALAPEHCEEVRRVKQAEHTASLRLYRQSYGAPTAASDG
jgi:hypothetical protein